MVALNGWAEIQNTILHEIAHALAPGHGHGRLWQMFSVAIGSSPERCYGDNVIMPLGGIVMECVNCGGSHRRLRKKKKPIACSDCCAKYNFGRFHKDFLLKEVA